MLKTTKNLHEIIEYLEDDQGFYRVYDEKKIDQVPIILTIEVKTI